MGTLKDLTNQKIGKLLLKRMESSDSRIKRWLCVCECGKEVVRTLQHINQSEGAFGCGCFNVNYRLCKDRELAAFINRYRKNIIYANKELGVSKNEISLEEYMSIVKQNCFYCGGKPENSFTIKSSSAGPTTIRFSGIDRILPQYGYIKNNVRPCCLQCNMAKSTSTTSNYLRVILKTNDEWGITSKSGPPIPYNDDPILPYFKTKKLRSKDRSF